MLSPIFSSLALLETLVQGSSGRKHLTVGIIHDSTSARGSTRFRPNVRPNSSAEQFGRTVRQTWPNSRTLKKCKYGPFLRDSLRVQFLKNNSQREIHFCEIPFLCKIWKHFPEGRYTVTLSMGQPTPIKIHSFANRCSINIQKVYITRPRGFFWEYLAVFWKALYISFKKSTMSFLVLFGRTFGRTVRQLWPNCSVRPNTKNKCRLVHWIVP